jgi:hypothetical protein
MISYKCFDSSRAIFVKSEKKAGGKSGWVGPKRAMMSHLGMTINRSEYAEHKPDGLREIDAIA